MSFFSNTAAASTPDEAELLPARPSFLPPGFGTVGHKDFVEIEVPAEVSSRPQTWGYLPLGALLLLLLVLALRGFVQRRRAQAYRRLGLRELALVRARYQDGEKKALREVSPLLKRVALAGFGRERVAPLAGSAWAQFLAASTAEDSASEGATCFLKLLSAGEDALTEQEVSAIFGFGASWIGRHRV